MTEIRSESKFIWSFIFKIILTPITLILILFKKRTLQDLFAPFTDLFKFLFEAKFTITIILINLAIYFGVLFLNIDITPFLNYPADILKLHIIPLITSGFLHADLQHLLLNMLGIFIFGRIVERKYTIIKTALIYLAALLLANIFSSLFHVFIVGDNIPGLGASGALMGIMAAAILVDPFYFTYELIVPLPVMVVGWITIYGDVTGLLSAAEDGIGHIAHLSGFISIALLLFLFSKQDDKKQLQKGFLINLISLIIGFGLYFYFFRN